METSSISKTPHKTPKRFVFGVKKSARVIRWYGSPKTFDAGVAMYAGMALMSVAGSAVVIGKKKEF